MLCRTDLLPRVGIFASDGPPPPLRVSVLAPTAQDSPSAWGNAPGIHATQESPALKARFIPGRPQSIIARAALSRAFSARYADNRIPGTMSRATDETAPLALQREFSYLRIPYQNQTLPRPGCCVRVGLPSLYS